jgi:hypothetical protein
VTKRRKGSSPAFGPRGSGRCRRTLPFHAFVTGARRRTGKESLAFRVCPARLGGFLPPRFKKEREVAARSQTRQRTFESRRARPVSASGFLCFLLPSPRRFSPAWFPAPHSSAGRSCEDLAPEPAAHRGTAKFKPNPRLRPTDRPTEGTNAGTRRRGDKRRSFLRALGEANRQPAAHKSCLHIEQLVPLRRLSRKGLLRGPGACFTDCCSDIWNTR